MTQLHAAPLALAAGALVGTLAGVLTAGAAGRSTGRPDTQRRWVAPALTSGVIAGVGIGVRFGTTVELPAYLFLVAVALPLSAIDVAVRKIPDRILAPAVPAAIALLALAANSAGAYGDLGRAVLAGIVSLTAYLALALATGQLGLGDCKAAGFCGIFLGYLGWTAAALGVLLAFVLAAAFVAARTVMNGTTPRNKTLAFAPFIFAGALVAVAVS